MAEKEIKSCSDCIHYDACYKIEHYGQSPETTALLCELYIDKNDVAPVKHGHWESNEYLAGIHMTRCSECKTEFYIQDLEEISGDGFINFCPNCGAKMDGGEEND